MTDVRIPPHNLQAERSILGALLLSKDARENGLPLLSSRDFYQPLHRIIFDTIGELYAHGSPVDIVTVGDKLRRDDLLEFCGGFQTLSSLQAETPAISGYPYYAEIIVSHASMRRVIQLCDEISDEAYQCPDDIGDLIDRLITEAKDISTPLGELPEGVWDIVDFMARPKEARPDWLIKGLLRELWRVVIVAEEGFGKTVLLHQIALCASRGIHPFLDLQFEPVTTLLVDCENPEDRLDDGFEYISPRLDSMAPAVRGTAYLWTQPGGINLRTRADRSRLETIIERYRPAVVCAGPIYKTFLAKSGESYELVAREVQSVWDRLRTRYHFALVLEAHASKGSGGVRTMDPEGSALWLRWSEFGLKMLRNTERNYGPNDDTHYDVKRFRRDRIRQHGWPSGLERSKVGMPWAARWDDLRWKDYISDRGESMIAPEPLTTPVVEDNDDPF